MTYICHQESLKKMHLYCLKITTAIPVQISLRYLGLYKAVSNAEYQQTWYQNNKGNRAKYNKWRAADPEYQESHRMLSQKHY